MPGQNQLYEDLALEHEKIIWGTVFHALREITGREMQREEHAEELNKNLGLLFPDHKRFFEVQWRGDTIITVYAPEIKTMPDGSTRRHRKIDENWKRRHWVLH